MSARGRRFELGLTAPSLLWLALLFVVPALIVVAIAFKPATPFGGVGPGWTLDTLRGLARTNYAAAFARTLWLSCATTVLCLVLAVPTGMVLARLPRGLRNVGVLLVVVPFWTSFLVRVFAWKVVLHPDGALAHLLAAAGLVAPGTPLLYNSAAVLLVMVYTELPFAILPVYAAAEKFDPALLEAARDLGATPAGAFVRVFLPAIRRGLYTAALVVFVPALGSYVVPDLVGGPSAEMIGNKIAQRTFVDRDLPQGAALSAALMAVVLLPAAATVVLRRRGAGEGA